VLFSFYFYTDCQGKKAQDTGNFESRPTDARPQDPVLILCPRAPAGLFKNIRYPHACAGLCKKKGLHGWENETPKPIHAVTSSEIEL
jgi:hypothetical protein